MKPIQSNLSARRVVMGLVGVLYLAGAGAWVMHEPYRPQRLLDAVPANASFVSVHDQLAARWTDLARTPVVMSILSRNEVDPNEVLEATVDEDVRVWVDKLAARRTVLAYVPQYGPLRRDAWVMATWIGWHARWLRWSEALGLFDDVQRRVGPVGTPYYELTDTSTNTAKRLTLALQDGILLACWSDHPSGVFYLQKRLFVNGSGYWRTQAAFDDAASPDRGLVGAIGSSVTNNPGFMQFRLNRVDAARMAGEVRGSPKWGAVTRQQLSQAQHASLGRLLGDLPRMVGIAPYGLWRRFLKARHVALSINIWWQPAKRLLSDPDQAPIVVALLGDEYRGRIGSRSAILMNRGVAVPALILAVPHADAELALSVAEEMVDRANRFRKYGVIPQRVQAGERAIYALEGTRENAYGELPFEERVAYAVLDEWVVFCSNAEVLQRLIARYDREEAMRSSAGTGWRGAFAEDPPMAFLWADGGRAVPELKAGLHLYRLLNRRKLRANEPRLRQFTRIVSAVEALNGIERIVLRVDRDRTVWTAQFSLGDAERPQGLRESQNP